MPKPSTTLPLLLLAVIAAALAAAALQPAPPASPVATAAPAPAAVAPAPLSPRGADDYDLETAMSLAGKELPASVQEYSFFALIDEPVPADEVQGLAAAFRDAARAHDYVGIAGPDAERNRRSLLAALDGVEPGALDGLTVVFVGPSSHRDELDRALRRAGATLRYVVYPREAPLV